MKRIKCIIRSERLKEVEELISTIVSTCCTGELGDGKIAVLPLEDVIRVRTGEHREEALV